MSTRALTILRQQQPLTTPSDTKLIYIYMLTMQSIYNGNWTMSSLWPRCSCFRQIETFLLGFWLPSSGMASFWRRAYSIEPFLCNSSLNVRWFYLAVVPLISFWISWAIITIYTLECAQMDHQQLPKTSMVMMMWWIAFYKELRCSDKIKQCPAKWLGHIK